MTVLCVLEWKGQSVDKNYFNIWKFQTHGSNDYDLFIIEKSEDFLRQYFEIFKENKLLIPC